MVRRCQLTFSQFKMRPLDERARWTPSQRSVSRGASVTPAYTRQPEAEIGRREPVRLYLPQIDVVPTRLLLEAMHVPHLAQRRRDLCGFSGALYTRSALGSALGCNWEATTVCRPVDASVDGYVNSTEGHGRWIVWMNGQPDQAV